MLGNGRSFEDSHFRGEFKMRFRRRLKFSRSFIFFSFHFSAQRSSIHPSVHTSAHHPRGEHLHREWFLNWGILASHRGKEVWLWSIIHSLTFWEKFSRRLFPWHLVEPGEDVAGEKQKWFWKFNSISHFLLRNSGSLRRRSCEKLN